MTDLTHIEHTVEIVAAFVAHNAVPPTELPGLIRSIHATIAGLGQPEPVKDKTPLVPAVPIGKSVHHDYLVSMLDGKRYKSLKRHIGVAGHTPQSYRAAFGLPLDYPMVCAAYAKKRSELAKRIGLGRKRAA